MGIRLAKAVKKRTSIGIAIESALADFGIVGLRSTEMSTTRYFRPEAVIFLAVLALATDYTAPR